MTCNPPVVLAAYGRVARHVILRYLERQSCIASTRITVEVMRHFQLAAKALPMRLVVECPKLKYAYVSGLTAAQKAHAKKQSVAWSTRGGGYDGHVVALVANSWIVDASIDQVESAEHGFTVPPSVLLVPVPIGINRRRMHIEIQGVTDNGHELKIRYMSSRDKTFYATPAWELCTDLGSVVDLVISAVRAEMLRQ